jgi:hypothetical protein
VLSAALSLGLALVAGLDLARGAAPRWAAALGLLLAAGMVALTLAGGERRATAASGDPVRLAGLARHLAATGARFYGVWWCEGCRDQKDMFGAAAAALPYVECSGGRGPTGVREYPTWDIAGHRLTGVQPVDTLAARSGF